MRVILLRLAGIKYENLVDAIEHGAGKCVRDEEVVKVLEILEEATEIAESHKQVQTMLYEDGCLCRGAVGKEKSGAAVCRN
jgi:hypothetical protein